jgi:membrane-associated protease RseP (regulator of RpoE activity)
MCRRYGVPATLPYFIPMPLSFFGTMGAVILMKGRIPDRRALFDVAVAGPIAGLVVAVPVLAFGLALSDVRVVQEGTGLRLGDPLVLRWLSAAIVGPVPEGHDIFLHPAAFAGWAGLFVTALNLLPLGQLDGGHVLYAMFGRVVLRYQLPMIGSLAILALATGYVGWAILAVLIAILTLRRPHPPTVRDDEPLDGRRFALGFVMMLVFVLCFTPRPFVIP